MKKVINRALYDTETAKLLGEDSHGSPRDFDHWCESLYRTKSGKYFLHGAGGAMTKYAISTGQNEWSGGEKIIPLTLESAQKWAEEHLSGDDYLAAFGEPEETTDWSSVVVSSFTKRRLEIIKEKTGKSFGNIIDEMITKYNSDSKQD